MSLFSKENTKDPAKEKEAPSTEVTEALKQILENQTRQDERLIAVEKQSQKMFSPEFLESLRGPGMKQPEPTKSTLPAEEDINGMNNSELLKLLGGMFDKGLGQLNDKYDKGINNVNARIELGKVAAKYDDFETQFPKMQEMWKKVPGLDIDNCYRLTKFGNDEAVAQAVESAKKEQQKVKDQNMFRTPAAPNFEISEDKTPVENINDAFDTIFGGDKE